MSDTTAEGLTEAEREALTSCDCGHDIGGEHNSYGCYGGGPACGCSETDDRPGVNFSAVERILADRLAAVQAEVLRLMAARDTYRKHAEADRDERDAARAEVEALRERVGALDADR